MKISLSPGNKSDDSFNFYLQKCIAQWEPNFKELSFNVEKEFVFNKKQEAIDGDIQQVRMLRFWCLFTPLSLKTPLTPTLF